MVGLHACYLYMVVHVLLHSMPYGYCTGEMREVVEVRLHDHEVMRYICGGNTKRDLSYITHLM